MKRAITLTIALCAAACGDDTSAGAGGAGGSDEGGNGDGGTPMGGSAQGGSGGTPAVGGGGGDGGEGGSFIGVDPIAGIADTELVQGGFQFLEGPVYLAALGVLRFSDIPANTIYELDPTTDGITVWSDDSNGTNGAAVTTNGDVLLCEQTNRRIARSAAAAPAPTLVAGEYEGGAFNSPNDVIERSDGQIYFTDPTYGLPGPAELDFRGVFRFDGTTVHLVDDTHSQPNGIALSPDETTLYVSDSDAGGLYAYDVAGDGSTSQGTLLFDASPSDGMAIDDAGNLYLTTGAGVEVYQPDGTPWGTITVPEQPANCTFGGADRRTLFITARTGLYRVHLNIPGLP